MYNCINMTFLTLPRLPIGTSLERRFILLIEIRNNIWMEIYLTHVGRGPYYYIVSNIQKLVDKNLFANLKSCNEWNQWATWTCNFCLGCSYLNWFMEFNFLSFISKWTFVCSSEICLVDQFHHCDVLDLSVPVLSQL